jgi:hypothetical protein
MGLVSSQCFGQKAEDLPDVKMALKEFEADEHKARERLVKDLQKAQDKATQNNKLDQAVSIRALKDRIAAGDVVPFEDVQLREKLDGTGWHWNRHWETNGTKVQFTKSEILFEAPDGSKQQHKYIVTSSRRLEYDGKKIFFSEDFTKFVAIVEGFNYRTGVKYISPKPVASKANPPANPGVTAGSKAGEEWAGNLLKIPFCWCPAGQFQMGSRSPSRFRKDFGSASSKSPRRSGARSWEQLLGSENKMPRPVPTILPSKSHGKRQQTFARN